MSNLNQNLVNLYKILSGKVEHTIDDTVYIYSQPDAFTLYLAEQQYNHFLEMYNGEFFSSEDMIFQLIAINLWSVELESEFQQFITKLDNLKISLYEAYEKYRNRDNIRADIQKLRNRNLELATIRNRYSVNTIESIAGDIKMQYVISRSTTPRIDIEDEYKINRMLFAISNCVCSDVSIRFLSKSQEWRAIWNCSDGNIMNIFNKPAVELNGEQVSLVNWSKFYDKIYESMERPPAEVVEDDDLLDGWVLLQNRKNNKNGERDAKVPPGTEVFVMVENPDDVSRIESKNDFMSKLIKKQRETAIIKSGGRIEEQYLPDAKQRITEQARMEQIRRMRNG